MRGDLAAAYASLVIVLMLRYGASEFEIHWLEHAGPFTVIFLIWLVIFYIIGPYDLDALRSRIALASRTAEALAAAFLVSIVVVFYAVPSITIAPNTNLIKG